MIFIVFTTNYENYAYNVFGSKSNNNPNPTNGQSLRL